MITYRLSFLTHAERSGRVSLMARLTMDGIKPVNVALGRSVSSVAMWDKSRQRVNPKDKGARDTNLLLSDIERDVAQFFTKIELVEQRTPTREEIVHCLKSAAGRTNAGGLDSLSIIASLDRYIAQTEGEWAHTTWRKYQTLRTHLQEYDEGAQLSQICDEWVAGYVSWLLHVKGVRNSTAGKYLRCIKTFLAWSEKVNGTRHIDYRPRLKGLAIEQKEIVYLTLEELRMFESIELNGTLAQVRDTFVFCCYTGLRFSDARRLRHDDDHDTYIEVVTQKTDERLKIESNKHSRAILDRYKRLPVKALPTISNQKSNDYLKDIARLCGIDTPVRRVWYVGNERHEEVVPKCDLISTHAARRTFVVTALQLGIPVEVIIRWTGHSDYESMRPYVAIVDELKRKNMEKFNTL